MFLGWYDDSPKKTAAVKIAEACAAYEERFGMPATTVLVNAAEACEVAGLAVVVKPFIRRNNYWAGLAEPAQD